MFNRFFLVAVSLLFLCACLPLHAAEGGNISINWNNKKNAAVISYKLGDTTIDDVTPASAEEIPALVEQLASEDDTLCGTAMLRLIKSSDAAVPALAKACRSDDRRLHLHASMALVIIDTKASRAALHEMPTPLLIRDLNGDDEDAKLIAPFLLLINGGKNSLDTVRPLLKDQSDLDEAIMMAAIFTGQKSLLPDVTAALRSPEAGERVVAVMAYFTMQKGKADDTLLGMLPDPDPSVRMMLMFMFGGTHYERSREALITIMLFDAEAGNRAMAAHALNMLKPSADDLSYLIRASKDEDANVRLAALSTLATYAHDKPTPEVMDAVQAAQSDTDAKIREAAKQAELYLKGQIKEFNYSYHQDF